MSVSLRGSMARVRGHSQPNILLSSGPLPSHSIGTLSVGAALQKATHAMQSSHQPHSRSRQCLSHSTATFAGSLSSLPPSTLHPHIPCWGTHLHTQKLTPSTFSSHYQVRRERVAGQAETGLKITCFLTQRRTC